MNTPRYKAFISYSHRDEKWARWLQRSLESYRLPRRLVGSQGEHGPIPKRLNPIFRDREDLSSAADLTSQIKEVLASSETLIIVCSPAAAASRWVNEEIRRFMAMGRGDRILALIVDGDPQARDPAAQCFPPALLESADGDSREPLAADVRTYADGKNLSRLKLVAGMLGIRLDELRQRDAQRRNRRRLGYSLAALLVLGVVGWLAYSEATTRAHARAQQSNTEELLGFMLGELQRLDPIEGLEIINKDDESQGLLAEQLGLSGLDDEQLTARALEWREAGIGHHQRGEMDEAMQQFIRSRAAFIELVRREGGAPDALFELGQAAFYVGYVHFAQGELDAAEDSIARYGAITRRLLNADPRNPKYVMELSYTLVNLGALEQARSVPDSGKFLQLTQSAVQYNQMALVLDPQNLEYRTYLGTNLAWLADAWLESCGLGNAFKFRNQAVDLRRELHAEFPDDPDQVRELAYALSGLAGVQQQMGLAAAATGSYQESAQLLSELLEADPGNAYLEWQVIYRKARQARQLLAIGDSGTAWALFAPLIERRNQLMASAGLDHASRVESARLGTDHARLLLLRGDTVQARRVLDEAIAQLLALVREKPGYRESLEGLARAYFEKWQDFGAADDAEIEAALQGYLARPEAVKRCQDADLAARLAIIDGDPDRAGDYTRYVLEKGYFEADFTAFCSAFELCTARPVAGSR